MYRLAAPRIAWCSLSRTRKTLGYRHGDQPARGLVPNGSLTVQCPNNYFPNLVGIDLEVYASGPSIHRLIGRHGVGDSHYVTEAHSRLGTTIMRAALK